MQSAIEEFNIASLEVSTIRIEQFGCRTTPIPSRPFVLLAGAGRGTGENGRVIQTQLLDPYSRLAIMDS
jgi:hypothetical protein